MKRVKKSSTTIFFSLLVFTVFTILLVNGCNKMNVAKETTDETTPLNKIAANHFRQLAEKEKAVSAQSSTAVKTKSTKTRITPLSKISALIEWEKASEIKREKLIYTIVPVKDDLGSFKSKNYDFSRSIIFYRDETGKNNMLILEALSKKGETLGTDLQKMASSAFENKYFSRSQDIDALSAYVLFFNENYIDDSSFQLVNGKWSPARISFRSDLEITQ